MTWPVKKGLCSSPLTEAMVNSLGPETRLPLAKVAKTGSANAGVLCITFLGTALAEAVSIPYYYQLRVLTSYFRLNVFRHFDTLRGYQKINSRCIITGMYQGEIRNE